MFISSPTQCPESGGNGGPRVPVVIGSGIVRRYGQGDTAVDALRGVSVDIAQGRLTAVMGPSGSGKSTLMHILAGLDRPTSGEVSVAGVEITALDDTELTKLRRDHIGFIFQFFNLLPMLTAAENIALPLKLAGGKPDPEWLAELIEKVGLGDRLTHRPAELSGGQQQRVAVARALVSRPSVMFADEPTGNLDSTTGGEILALLRDSVDTLGQTTVMVTHDAHAAAIADRVLFLADGRIVRDLGRSSAHEILATLEEMTAAMIAVALKGVAGRKVRALLTALAIVIGVTMVSGTLVLTDTIQKGFDSVFGASYAADRRGDRRQGDRQGLPERGRDRSRVAARAGTGAARGRGGRWHDRADRVQPGRDLRPRRQGRRLRRRTPVRTRQRRVAAAVQPAQAQDRPVARRVEAGRPRRRHGGRAALQSRRHGHRGNARSQAPLRR